MLDRLVPWLLGLAAAAACVLCFPDWPTEWDSVQLTLGVDRFDIREGSPHPPGYWLYLAAGRAVRSATPLSAQESLQVLAALAAGVTVALAYVVGREARSRWLGLTAAVFVGTSPYLLFYGSIVASYAFDALLSTLLLLLALRARPGSVHGVLAAVALGLGAGLRPSAAVVLAPVALWAAWKSARSVRAAAAVIGAGALGLAVWAVPMVLSQPGGLGEYVSFSRDFYRSGASTTSLLSGASLAQARYNALHTAAYTAVAVAPLIPPLLIGLVAWRHRERGRREPVVLLAVSAGFAFAFLAAGYFGKAGYVLSYLPAMALLALWPLAGAPPRLRMIGAVVLVVMCAGQAARFATAPAVLPKRLVDRTGVWVTQPRYGAPYFLTRAQLRNIDADVEAYRAIGELYDPGRDVVVIASANGGYRFRHVCFVLPSFRVHFLRDNADFYVCRGGRMPTHADGVIEVPPGGRALLAFDVETPELAGLQRRDLPSGKPLWLAPPGTKVYGVTVVEAPEPAVTKHLP